MESDFSKVWSTLSTHILVQCKNERTSSSNTIIDYMYNCVLCIIFYWTDLCYLSSGFLFLSQFLSLLFGCFIRLRYNIFHLRLLCDHCSLPGWVEKIPCNLKSSDIFACTVNPSKPYSLYTKIPSILIIPLHQNLLVST